jgi:nitrate reductase cytochrome c-type subunit
MREVVADVGNSHLSRVTFVVKEDKVSNVVEVRFFCLQAEVLETHDFSDSV